MPEIPLLSSHDLVRILGSFGFSPVRETGTHRHLYHAGRLVTVPSHPVLALGVILPIIRKADIETEAFLRLAMAPGTTVPGQREPGQAPKT